MHSANRIEHAACNSLSEAAGALLDPVPPTPALHPIILRRTRLSGCTIRGQSQYARCATVVQTVACRNPSSRRLCTTSASCVIRCSVSRHERCVQKHSQYAWTDTRRIEIAVVSVLSTAALHT